MGAAGNTGEARKKSRPYRCFLVRCWLEEGAGPGGQPAWRYTVQEAHDGGLRRPFNCLKDVEVYLQAELGSTEGSVGRR